MTVDSLVLVAGRYDRVEYATADFLAVKEVFDRLEATETFDAAVISRDRDGRVQVVRRFEQSTSKGSSKGVGIGLAVGALVAVLPGIGIAAALLGGGVLGAGVGAIRGHIERGMSKADLDELSELIGAGESGLIVVAEAAVAPAFEHEFGRATKTARKNLRADPDAIRAAQDR